MCLGVITGAHGVRGLVRIKPFTERPDALTAYGPLQDEAGGRSFTLTTASWQKGQWLAQVDGVRDRDAAEALRGTGLFVDRSRLPAPAEEEFYHADLIGLRVVEHASRSPLGTVIAVHDFGAGDVIDVRLDVGGSVAIPFTREACPHVAIADGVIEVVPPQGLLDADGRPARR